MAFTVSGLSAYTKKATELFLQGVLLDDSKAEFDSQDGIQYKQFLNFIDVDPIIGADACDYTVSGNTTITERTITVVPMKAQQKYCFKDLYQKALSSDEDVKVGVTNDTIAKLTEQVNKILWQGNTTPAVTGWIEALNDDSGIINMSGSTTFTVDNILGIISGMTAEVTDRMRARFPLTMYCSYNTYDLYKAARFAQDNYLDISNDLGPNEMWLLQHKNTIKIKAVAGLNGVDDDIIMTWPQNLVIGYDEVFDKASMKWQANEITEEVYLTSKFKIGASYKYGEEAVTYRHPDL